MRFFSHSIILAGLIPYATHAQLHISKANQIPVSSDIGMNILSQSRRLEDSNDLDISFLPNYSFKVQGCSHITDWNYEANEADEVRLTTQRLLRLRLCPSNSCGSQYGLGCDGNNYGDYVIPLDTFLTNYLQYRVVADAEDCYEFSYKKCGCEDNQECDFQCWYKHEMSQCYTDYTSDGNEDDKGYRFPYENYMSCTEWNPDEYRRRKLDEAVADDANDEADDMAGDDANVANYGEEQQYYIGPYCAKQGTRVYLGLFTDDTCTDFAGSHGGSLAFESLTGDQLPYSQMPLISKDCVRCNVQLQDAQNQRHLEDAEADEEDEEDKEADEENGENDEEYYGYEFEGGFCEGVYLNTGKCERNLNAGNQDYRGCNFINGISFIEQYTENRKHGVLSYINYYANEGLYYVDSYINYLIMITGALCSCFMIQIFYKKRSEYFRFVWRIICCKFSNDFVCCDLTELETTEKVRMKEFEASLESDARIKASYLAMQ